MISFDNSSMFFAYPEMRDHILLLQLPYTSGFTLRKSIIDHVFFCPFVSSTVVELKTPSDPFHLESPWEYIRLCVILTKMACIISGISSGVMGRHTSLQVRQGYYLARELPILVCSGHWVGRCDIIREDQCSRHIHKVLRAHRCFNVSGVSDVGCLSPEGSEVSGTTNSSK